MNEFFSLLCYDVDGIAEKVAPELFRHGRSISLHGVRGSERPRWLKVYL